MQGRQEIQNQEKSKEDSKAAMEGEFAFVWSSNSTKMASLVRNRGTQSMMKRPMQKLMT